MSIKFYQFKTTMREIIKWSDKKLDNTQSRIGKIKSFKGRILDNFAEKKKNAISETSEIEPDIEKEIAEAEAIAGDVIHNLIEPVVSTKTPYINQFNYVTSKDDAEHSEDKIAYETSQNTYLSALRAEIAKYTTGKPLYNRIMNKHAAIRERTKKIHTEQMEKLEVFYDKLVGFCNRSNKIIEETSSSLSLENFKEIPEFINTLDADKTKLHDLSKKTQK